MMMADASMERRRSSRFPPKQRSPSKTPDVQAPAPHTSPPVSASTKVTEAKAAVDGDEAPSAKRSLRKRKAAAITSDPVEEAMKPLTCVQRQSWNGWIELESDPILFSHVLQSYGVKDVRVQEVLELDSLSHHEKPLYGLIFLFQYQDSDAEEDENIPKCPKHVWFANQTTDNSCATVALLNIVLNTDGINLGSTLVEFKKSTQKLKPAYRGKKLGENAYIRNIHNSFVRRMDILNADLALQNEYDRWIRRRRDEEKPTHVPKPKNAKNAKSKAQGATKPARKKKQDDGESGFHFIAYVPINGYVWKLDGLHRHPVNIGRCGDNWAAVAGDNILQRTTFQQGSIQYNLMSLVESPLVELRHKIAQVIKTIEKLEETLDLVVPDWKVFTSADVRTYKNDLDEFNITRSLIEDSEILTGIGDSINRGAPGELIKLRNPLGGQLSILKNTYSAEKNHDSSEFRKAEARVYDHTSDIYNSIKVMSETGALKEIVLGLQD